MIQQILEIAGVDNMDEFHKKYPTKEKFLKAYPEASRLFEKHEKENFNPVAAYGGSMDHLDQMQYAKGGSVPENSKLWSQAKALAKSKFDVYPSKYANNWASKWYKQKGGTWRKAAYGGMMYGEGGQIGGRVDQLGHYNPSMDLRGGQSTVKQGHYQIGGVTAAGSGTHGQQYSIQHGVATPMPSKAYGGYYQTGGTTYQPQGSTTNGQQYTIQNGVATPVPSRAYGGYYQEGGTTEREEAKSKILQLIQTYAKMVGVPAQQIVDQLNKLEAHKAAEVLKNIAKQVKQSTGTGYASEDMGYEDTGGEEEQMYAAYGGKLPREVLRSRLESHMSPSEADEYLSTYAKGGIHINPAKKGTFTAQATRMGMGVQEAARHILADKDSYSPGMVRKANFARNASKWKHQEGGEAMPQEMMEAPEQQMQEQAMGQEQPQQGGGQEQMMQQLVQMVTQALQQGMDPQQIVQMLVQQGVPQDIATQVVQMVMQQMQGGAPQGNAPQGGPGQQYQPQGEQYQGPQGQPQAAYGGMSDGIFYNQSTSPY